MRKLTVLCFIALLLAPLAALAQSNPYPAIIGGALQSAAAATGNGSTLDVTRSAIAVIQTSGTFVGTVTYEASLDGTTWSALTCYALGGSTGASTATAAAIVRCNVTGLAQIRGRVSAYTSGAITVMARATSFGMPPAATNN